MTSAVEIADAVKFSTLGLSFGIMAGGLTEYVANEVIDSLALDTQDNGAAETLAEVLVRGAIGSVGYLLAARVFSNVNARRDDPTEGSYFIYGFSTAQRGLYRKTLQLAAQFSSGAAWGAKAPCCDDCAGGEGTPCAGH